MADSAFKSVKESQAFKKASSIANKLPPQNIEAEQSLLGALLIDKDAIVTVAEILNPDHFYKTEQHGHIYSAIVKLFEKREPVDVVTVTDKLRQDGVLDIVGGPAYLTELVNMVPTAAHVLSYARIIKGHAIRRQLISSSTRFVDMAYDEGIEISDIIEESEQVIFGISQGNVKRDFIQLKDALAQSFDRLDELQKSSGKLRGVPTGFRDLDNKLAGLQDSNLIIFAARPGMGKCLAYDSKIVDPNTGEVLTIEEFYKKKQQSIFTLNSSLKIEKTTISNFVDDGKKEVFEVQTATGRIIEVTASHPFLTLAGWKKLYELGVGDKIATPREIPVFGNLDLESYQAKAIAYFLSDGGLTRVCPRFTNSNPLIVADFIESVRNFDNIAVRKYDSNGTRTPSYEVVKDKIDKTQISQNFSSQFRSLTKKHQLTQMALASTLRVSAASIGLWVNGDALPSENNLLLLTEYFNQERDYFVPNTFFGFKAKNSVTRWLEELGLMGKGALEKTVPKIIFTLTKDKLALFLNRLFACDGCAHVNPKGGTISYSSSSKEMIYQVSHLLLRFGILSKVRLKKIKYKGGINLSYELEIHAKDDILRFCKEIGIFGKEEQVKRVVQQVSLNTSQDNFTKDTLPIEVWDQILSAKGNIPWRQLYPKMGLPLTHNIHVNRRNPRRSTVLKIAKVLNSKSLADLATSDIFWDKIISIKSKGYKQVYDLTIPNTHNFVANDFFVHNTSFALGLAQHVAVNTNLPVGIFSLEMSQEELVDRLLVSQADIDAWRLKTGKLDEKDYDRLSHAMGQLAEAPLFIDDTPGASISEIRTKSRRLQAEHGLKLIIVDYLQLIKGRNQENRVQEVSEISQGLKNLARELKVPVLALSQLNRSVEARGTKKPQLADLRESGCLAGETLLRRADTGQIVTMKDLVGKTNIPVLSLSQKLRLEVKLISKVFSSGYKQLFLIKTRNGRSIKASANHPFLTKQGWQRVDHLRTGVLIGQQGYATSNHSHGYLIKTPNRNIYPHLLGLYGIQEESFSFIPAIDNTISSIYWDEIISITPLGIEEVFDATVPGTHNFVANGFIVHNSIEQDADVVMFIYREDTENMEQVKLDIQKHRNGPTGEIDLIFRGDRVKFYGMEKTRRPQSAPKETEPKSVTSA